MLKLNLKKKTKSKKLRKWWIQILRWARMSTRMLIWIRLIKQFRIPLIRGNKICHNRVTRQRCWRITKVTYIIRDWMCLSRIYSFRTLMTELISWMLNLCHKLCSHKKISIRMLQISISIPKTILSKTTNKKVGREVKMSNQNKEVRR